MDANPYSVLVVDTDAESLFSIDRAFKEHGFRVHLANDVEQAISIGIRERLDLLVSRFRLDVETAVVLAMRLRTVKRLSQMPALFLCENQHAGVVLRTNGASPEYSMRYPANIAVMIHLATLTIHCHERSDFEKSVPPPIPYPHAPFTKAIDTQPTNFV